MLSLLFWKRTVFVMDVSRTATLSSSSLINPRKEFARAEFFPSRALVSFTGLEEVRVLKAGCR